MALINQQDPRLKQATVDSRVKAEMGGTSMEKFCTNLERRPAAGNNGAPQFGAVYILGLLDELAA